MYAIVTFQGFQYRVSPGQTLRVPALDQQNGEEVAIPRVLVIADGEAVLVGRPTIPDAMVRTEVVRHGRGPKIIIGKYKRRKDYRRRRGYRSDFTELRVKEIVRP